MADVPEMVERVARVLAPSVFTGAMSRRMVPEELEVRRKHAFEVARAVIQAMREPSEAMALAAVPEPPFFYPEDTELTIEEGRRYLAEYRRRWVSEWQCAIDAALSAPPAAAPTATAPDQLGA